jgi:hypothetical protein
MERLVLKLIIISSTWLYVNGQVTLLCLYIKHKPVVIATIDVKGMAINHA